MAVLTRTYTRTHVYVEFANPYLACTKCTSWVTAWHDDDRCDCGDDYRLQPCGHRAEAFSACPSWGPVDACQCQAHLGYVPHPEPS